MRRASILLLAVCFAPAVVYPQLLRIGLHKVINPGVTTFDTVGFFPPVQAPSDPALRWFIRGLTVRLDSIVFPRDQALDISISHAGRVDTLVHGLVRSGSDFRETVFADTAGTPIDSGTPPYSGIFAPAEPLSQFGGTDATGIWILQITNHTTDRTGILEEWGAALDIVTVFTSVGTITTQPPDAFHLFQNFPNPFNPSTVVEYSIPRRSRVRLSLFNGLGQQIAILFSGEQEAGVHQVLVEGSSLASGVYYCRLQAAGYAEAKRLLLLR